MSALPPPAVHSAVATMTNICSLSYCILQWKKKMTKTKTPIVGLEDKIVKNLPESRIKWTEMKNRSDF